MVGPVLALDIVFWTAAGQIQQKEYASEITCGQGIPRLRENRKEPEQQG